MDVGWAFIIGLAFGLAQAGLIYLLTRPSQRETEPPAEWFFTLGGEVGEIIEVRDHDSAGT